MDDRPEVMDPREQRLNDVLGAYLEAEDSGWAPDQGALLTRYPEFKSDLEAFFVAQSRVAALAYPCPASAQRQGRDADVNGASDDGPATMPRTGSNGSDDGRSVGDYELVELINEGGMGKVYKAKLKWTDSWVALKKIKTGRLASRTEVRRFLDEVRAAASLRHPNIVPIYHVGEDNGQPFFTMQLFEHGSLQQHLPRFEKDHRAAADLVAKVARAVHHAHQYAILHRDLKPANILLDAQEQPYVADFGLAKRLRPAPAESADAPAAPGATKSAPPTARERKTDAGPAADLGVHYLAPEQTSLTQPLAQAGQTQDRTVTDAKAKDATRVGTFLGTKGYIPPEHTEVSTEGTSTAADVYSLGAILYKMLTGKTLFDSATTLADAVRQVKECAPEPPHTLNPKTDERLEAICMKCLQKDPRQRYQSAELLAEDLERWLRGEPPEAWPLPLRLRAWRAIRPYLFSAALASCLGFAAAAIFFVYYYFDPDRVPQTIEQEARKWPVTLLGETGLPRWSRWNVGEGTVMVSPEQDQPFSFSTLEHGRLELMPKAPGPHYRLTAEVRHDKAFEGVGMVGIYFAHVERSAGDETKRYWCDFKFADLGTFAVNNTGPNKLQQWGAGELVLQRYSLPHGPTTRLTEARELFESAQITGKNPAWRQLVVEVTAEHVHASWDGKPLQALSRAELRGLNQSTIINGKVVIPDYEFAREGALGLYAYKSKASFRNVVIEGRK